MDDSMDIDECMLWGDEQMDNAMKHLKDELLKILYCLYKE